MNCLAEAGNLKENMQNIWVIIKGWRRKMSDRYATLADVEKTERLMGDYWNVVENRIVEISKASEARILAEIKEYKGMFEKMFSLIDRTLSEHTNDLKTLRGEIKYLKNQCRKLEVNHANHLNAIAKSKVQGTSQRKK